MKHLCNTCAVENCDGERATARQRGGEVVICEHYKEKKSCETCEFQCNSGKEVCEQYKKAEKCPCGIGYLKQDGRCRTCDACGGSCCG